MDEYEKLLKRSKLYGFKEKIEKKTPNARPTFEFSFTKTSV